MSALPSNHLPNPDYDPNEDGSLPSYPVYVFAENALDRAPRRDYTRLFVYLYGDAADVESLMLQPGKSRSELDIDFACLLARYGSRDPVVIEAVMRDQSPLRRPKWDERRAATTLLGFTVKNALRRTRDDPDPRTLGMQPEATVRWRLHTGAQLLAMPEPAWLVKDAIFAGGLTLLYGMKGTYKSFVALSLAHAIATGAPWIGGRTTTPGVVVYIVAEGRGFFRRRVEALGCASANIRYVTVPVNLFRGEAAAFAEHVRAQLGDVPVALFVFDTLARSMVGGEENSNSDMATVVEAAQSLQLGSDAAVLLVHHTGKDGLTARGGYSLECAGDVILRLDKTGDKAVTLTSQNTKDWEEPDPLRLSLVPAGQSLKVEAAGQEAEGAAGDDGMRTMLEALARITTEGATTAVARLEGAAMERGVARRRIDELLRDAEAWQPAPLIDRPHGRNGGIHLTAAGREMCRPEVG